jgi:hypothetical protein
MIAVPKALKDMSRIADLGLVMAGIALRIEAPWFLIRPAGK